MKTAIFALLVLGQIQVPKETEDRHPVIATIQARIPDKATIEGPGWRASEGVRFVEVDRYTIHIWADPGEHQLTYKVMWVWFEDFTFTDGSGKSITIKQYMGHGYVEEKADFKILGEVTPPPQPDPVPPTPNPTPPPNPDPTPSPVSKYQVLFLLESNDLDNLPIGQVEILSGLVFRKQLAEKGHRLLGSFDVDSIKDSVQFKPYATLAKGEKLPLVMLAPVDGGEIKSYPLPSNTGEMFKLLETGK